MFEDTIQSINYLLFDIHQSVSRKVDFVRFHWPDGTSGEETIIAICNVRFIPKENQKFVFDFKADEAHVIYRKDELEADYEKRISIFKQKFDGKMMLVKETYFEVINTNYDFEPMIEYHVFLTPKKR